VPPTATAAVLEECSCTAIVVVGGCPLIVAEGGAAVLRVRYRPYGTSGEHR
jgi:hypothetical protein